MADHPQNERHDANEPNEFLRSVIDLSPDDIVTTEKKKGSLLSFLTRHIRTAIFGICLIVLIGSGVYLTEILIDYGRADSIYDHIGDVIMGEGGGMDMMFGSPQSPLTPDYNASQNLSDDEIQDITSSGAVDKDYERIRNKLYGLKQKYPDLYGWIHLPGTVISYPIMQSTDNDYYLDHSYTGTKLKAGSIFADYRCMDELMRNYNLVLYGHHMTNNAMFNSLDKFLDRKFFDTNNIIYVYTLDGMFTYRVFSVYETVMTYPYIRTRFDSREHFLAFAKEICGNSIHQVPDQTFTTDDRILTLSTCTNRSEEGRLAVHAVMIDYRLVKSGS